jgi:hypothetical protein
MATEITLNTIVSGTSPFDIWVCDSCSVGATCQYIGTFTSGELPYTFSVPEVFDTFPIYYIKIIDDNGCEFCDGISSIYKQFQDDELFEFMDGEEYEFQ